MSAELREKLALRFDRLDEHMRTYEPFLARIDVGYTPNRFELGSLAYMLMIVYGEVESIFKEISLHCGETLPDTESWHRDLLDSMLEAGEKRDPVISALLHETLRDYLTFRHFSRYATVTILEWEKASPLVKGVRPMLTRFRAEMDSFLEGLDE